VLFVVVIFGANIGVFQAEGFSWSDWTTWFDFVSSYITIPLAIALYLGHKWWHKTRLVPLKDCDFSMPRE
ncbi:hypothetical protein ACO1LC_14070, partial [Staphylococcus aureus]